MRPRPALPRRATPCAPCWRARFGRPRARPPPSCSSTRPDGELVFQRVAHHPARRDRRPAAAHRPRASPGGSRGTARPSGWTTWPPTLGTSRASAPRRASCRGRMICVPMVSKDSCAASSRCSTRSTTRPSRRRSSALAQTLADHAAIAIENASLYRQAYVASITDDLTGLGNTRHFHRTLAEVLTRGRPVSLIVLDLDNFKAVVDRYGHLAGSRVDRADRPHDRRAGPARRRRGALRRRRVRDRPPRHGRCRGGAARGVDPQGHRGVPAPSRARTSTSRGSRRASASPRSRSTRPTARACSGRRTPPCTRPSDRARTG